MSPLEQELDCLRRIRKYAKDHLLSDLLTYLAGVEDGMLRAIALGNNNLPHVPLRTIERKVVEQALQTTMGNRALAARSLGIPERTFYRMLKRFDLKKRR